MKNKTLIIAEAGVNHNGNKDMAFALIDAAVDSAVPGHLSTRSRSTRLYLAHSEARVPGLCGLSYACNLEL